MAIKQVIHNHKEYVKHIKTPKKDIHFDILNDEEWDMGIPKK